MSPTNRQALLDRKEVEAEMTRARAMLKHVRSLPDTTVLDDLKQLRTGGDPAY